MNPDQLLEVLRTCADRVARALDDSADWSAPGSRATQHACDVTADRAAVEHLLAAGCGVLSEERAPLHLDREAVVVVDPVDGTRNALAGIPWFGPSLCGLLSGRPVAAVVLNLATGDRYEGVTGQGVALNGRPARPRRPVPSDDAVVVTSGRPGAPTRSRPSYGALAFALADVAVGRVDGLIDHDDDHHRTWDYAAGLFLCQEAGAVVADGLGRDLGNLLDREPRAPVAARDPELLSRLLAERSAWSVRPGLAAGTP